MNSPVNNLLEILESKIDLFARVNGLDKLINMPAWKIAGICVDSLRKELIEQAQIDMAIKNYKENEVPR